MRRFLIFGLMLTLLLSGCGAARKIKHPVKSVEQTLGHPPTLDLTVYLQPDANNDSPVAFDLVLAKDKALVKQLSSMSATDWFNKRAQIERDNQAKVQVRSWEWVPGQAVGKVQPPVQVAVEVLGIVGFANYSTAGDHRAIMSLGGSDTITFTESDFSVVHAK